MSTLIYQHLGLGDMILCNGLIRYLISLETKSEKIFLICKNSNLKSVFLLTKYLYPKLKEAKGSIINISSVHATHTSQNIGIYATSKGGLTTLTRSMAIEFGKDKIRVNAILPGAINTGMLRAGLKRGHLGDDTEDELVNILGSKHILGKIGEPSDIAEMTYFLANNDKSSFITGQSFYVDGGATIKLSTE